MSETKVVVDHLRIKVLEGDTEVASVTWPQIVKLAGDVLRSPGAGEQDYKDWLKISYSLHATSCRVMDEINVYQRRKRMPT